MIKNINKEETNQELIIKRVKDIISESNENSLPDDEGIKYNLRIIFTEDKEFTHIVFPNIKKRNKNEFSLVNKFVELIVYIFSLPIEKRKSIYSISANSIEDKQLNEIIKEIKIKLNDINCIKFDTQNIDKIYKIIIKLFEANETTLGGLLEIIVVKIGLGIVVGITVCSVVGSGGIS